jgi:hypothetical protein
MLTKYKITTAGLEELRNNRAKYLKPTVACKLMHILSMGVGYTLDSLTSQVLADPRLRTEPEGAIIRAINNLQNLGYVEVFNQ